MSTDQHIANGESGTQVISYSGLDDTYYVSVPRKETEHLGQSPATLAVPAKALQPESDQELVFILDQNECELKAEGRKSLREKTQRFRRK